MRHSNLLIVLLCSLVFVVGCETKSKSYDGEAVKTTSDHAKEAARRVEERGGCKYPQGNIYTSYEHSFSFKYPQDWSVIPENQKSDMVVMLTRSVPVNGYLPNFCISVEKENPYLFQKKGAYFQNSYGKYLANVKILELEHGKLDDVDAIFVRYKGSVNGTEMDQTKILFNDRGKLYSLTFSSPFDKTKQVNQQFDEILATFKAGQNYRQ